MGCVNSHSRSQLSFLTTLLCSWALCCSVEIPQAEANTYTQAELQLQTIDLDLIFNGNLRQTEINSIDIVLREQLADKLDGALLFGYLNTIQDSNPIFAAQDLGGEYAGFDLRLHLINASHFKMQGKIEYRYNWVDADVADQNVEWNWHQSELSLYTQTYISRYLSIGLGVSAMTIDGVEKARGPVNQNIDFKAKDGLTGHIGLQLGLDQAGQIGVELKTGSLQGGRIVFQRSF